MRLVMLGLPPATNNLYATVGGRIVISTAGRASHTAWHAVAARKWTDGPSSAPFAVMVVYHLRRFDRDVDGSHKAVIDGFKGVVWRDDKQVILLSARKVRVPRDVFPYVTVIVRELAIMPSYGALRVPGGALAFVTDIWPPTTNNSYVALGGRRRKTLEAKSIGLAYGFELARMVRNPPAIVGSARLKIRYGIVADRRDVEGSHKLIVDAMRGLVWRDDSAIMSFSVAKARLPKGGQPVIDVVTWSLKAESAR